MFSFKPLNQSILPSIAALVRTLVVLETSCRNKLGLFKAALVIPNNKGT
jgi:hypothetical protein